jgi:hypothetical protein
MALAVTWHLAQYSGKRLRVEFLPFRREPSLEEAAEGAELLIAAV